VTAACLLKRGVAMFRQPELAKPRTNFIDPMDNQTAGFVLDCCTATFAAFDDPRCG